MYSYAFIYYAIIQLYIHISMLLYIPSYIPILLYIYIYTYIYIYIHICFLCLYIPIPIFLYKSPPAPVSDACSFYIFRYLIFILVF